MWRHVPWCKLWCNQILGFWTVKVHSKLMEDRITKPKWLLSCKICFFLIDRKTSFRFSSSFYYYDVRNIKTELICLNHVYCFQHISHVLKVNYRTSVFIRRLASVYSLAVNFYWAFSLPQTGSNHMIVLRDIRNSAQRFEDERHISLTLA